MRSHILRIREAFLFVALVLFSSPTFAQEGTTSRASRGDLLGTVNGIPRYREDSGWDQTGHLTDSSWAFQYDTELNGGQPWAVVLQGDRINNGLSVSANALTLDLNGHSYELKGYLSQPGNQFHPSFFNVSGQENGASLRVTNGTLKVHYGLGGALRVGNNSSAGLLTVEDATIQATTVNVGAATDSPGTVILRGGGQLESGSSRDINIGTAADGMVKLVGPGSELIAHRNLNIGNATNGAAGQLIVADPNARMQVGGKMFIKNPVPNASPAKIGLTIHAGQVDVSSLNLGNDAGTAYGAVLIDGGSLQVDNSVLFNNASGGSQVFLNEGELNIASARIFNPTDRKEFFWKNGTLRYMTAGTTLSRSQIVALTTQGALSYQGGRAAGTIATGQTLAFDTTGMLHAGEIGLAGGTIAAGDTVRIYNDGTLSGYGTIDATLIGKGSVISSAPDKTLAIGALGGSATLSGQGIFQVGQLGIDATYSGTASGSGGFHKVGGGAQTITGSLANTGGIFVDGGTLAMTGSAASLTAPQVTVAEGGHLELLSDATGQGSVTNQGWVTNNGVITGDVTGGGRLSGTGQIAGAVDILGGGTLTPGNSVGSLAMSNLTLQGGSTLSVQMASTTGTAGNDWDLAVVGQTLQVLSTASNPVIVALQTLAGNGLAGPLANFDPSAEYSWQIIAASLANPGSFTSDQFLVDATGFANLAPGQIGNFWVAGASDGLYLNYDGLKPAAVPEPSPAVLLLLAGLGVFLVRRLRPRTTIRTECECP